MAGDRYFYGRAEAELKMAQQASDPAAIRAHYELANRYLDQFYHANAADDRSVMRDVPQA